MASTFMDGSTDPVQTLDSCVSDWTCCYVYSTCWGRFLIQDQFSGSNNVNHIEDKTHVESWFLLCLNDKIMIFFFKLF